MITHVVMIKLKDPTSENVDKAVRKIRELDGQIEVLKSLKVGADIVRSERSYDLALIARFENLADLKTYNKHPVHVPVLEYIGGLASAVAAVDFEIE